MTPEKELIYIKRLKRVLDININQLIKYQQNNTPENDFNFKFKRERVTELQNEYNELKNKIILILKEFEDLRASEIITMHYLEDKEIKEIAQILGLSNTYCYHLHRNALETYAQKYN